MNVIMKGLIAFAARGALMHAQPIIFPQYLHSIGIQAVSPIAFAEATLSVFPGNLLF